MKLVIVVSLAAPLALSSFAFADVVPKRIEEDLGNMQNEPTLNNSPSAISGSNWQIQSGSDKSKVSIKVMPKDGKFNTSLTFSAPINKDSDSSNFNRSNELVNGVSAKLGFWQVSIPKSALAEIDPVDSANMQSACQNHPDQFNGVGKDVSKCTQMKLSELYDSFHGEDAEAKDLVKKYRKWEKHPYYLYGATVEAGKSEFKYLKPNSLEQDEASKTASSIGVFGSVRFPSFGLLTLKTEYQNLYKTADTETRCPTGATSATVKCISAAAGEPKNIDRDVTTLEGRFKDPISLIKGVSPTFSYSNKEHKLTFDLPIFVLGDGKGAYTGGINSNWNNDDHKWVFSVFVGSKFSEI